ncbi:MAG: alpha/beta hydrolase, partial [Proteobacteria bacterium]|nr:alpha/beta hydrolase [Pseudomonadota bacterium]
MNIQFPKGGRTTHGISVSPGNALDLFSNMNPAHRLDPVELPDGARIQVWVSPGIGTPLLFLYGLGCSNAHWKYQVKHFQNLGALTIQLDLRGHGASTLGTPPRPLSI